MASSHKYHGSKMMDRDESKQHIKIYLKKKKRRQDTVFVLPLYELT